MSLQDTLFTEDAEEDVKEFLKNETRKRVLVFPPVNNYRRFLIHRLVQDHYSELLQTFSIGQGYERRLIVCYKSDFIRPPQANGVTLQAIDSPHKSSCTMGIESQCTPTASPEHNAHKARQVKCTPAVEIYRPPAARRARLEKSPVQPPSTEQTASDACARTNRQKRPDRAVYVPRHRRGAPEVETTPTLQKSPKEMLPLSSKASVDEQPIQKEMKVQPIPLVNCVEETMEYQEIINETPTMIEPAAEKADEEIKSDVGSEAISSSMKELQDSKEKKTEESIVCLQSDKRDRRKSIESNNDDATQAETQTASSITATVSCNPSETCNNKTSIEEVKPISSLRKVKNESCQVQDNEVVKQTLVSKVLIISSDENEKETKSPIPVTPVIPLMPPEKKVKKVERPKSKPAPPPLPPSKTNRDEYDWDSLFDDNGDCLDPTLIEELSSAVGEVIIEQPKSSCRTYSKPIEVSSDEFAHVLEIYNFPSNFKSSDLAAVFNPFKSGGFELKWVDDTHCLGVFSSPLVAAEVLASDHPFVKTRPLSEATALSKTKARRSSEYLQPYRTRPETCAALARRLVTKSLGVTLATARQEREQEKILLREAKEKKRLANKQREDVWEGIIGEKPTT